MGLLSWIILGGIAGAIAKKIMGSAIHGFWVTVAVGVVGGLVGGLISEVLFGIPMGHFFDIRSWVIAILGAIGCLAAFRLVNDKFLNPPKDTTAEEPTTGEHRKLNDR